MNEISRKGAKKMVLIYVLIASAFLFMLPQAEILAQTPLAPETSEEREIKILFVNETTPASIQNQKLPQNEIKILHTRTVTVTAYNATPEQTDSTPCLTADGTNVCDNKDLKIVAANWLPFGTKVRIPEMFGETIFEVHDRMNPRYDNRLDILLASVQEAKQFGRQTLTVEVLN